MNGRVIYIGAFLLAFVFVSSAIIYLNTIYTNIFKYDFTPVAQQNQIANNQQNQQQEPQQQLQQTQAQKIDSAKIAQAAADTVKPIIPILKKDTIATAVIKDSVKTKKEQKIQNAQTAVTATKTEQPKAADESITSKISPKANIAQQDTTYTKWIKKTGKLYEAMDAKKAAKIILGYSDNIARDLLLSMRQKKAAEILSEIKPEVATRIISVDK